MSTELVQVEEGSLGTSVGQSNGNLIRPVDTERGRVVAISLSFLMNGFHDLPVAPPTIVIIVYVHCTSSFYPVAVRRTTRFGKSCLLPVKNYGNCVYYS